MSVLKFPIATEKSVSLITKSNTITYIVDYKADKTSIKKEFERMFEVKVSSINIINVPRNEKKAFIKLTKEYDASNVAMKLKLV